MNKLSTTKKSIIFSLIIILLGWLSSFSIPLFHGSSIADIYLTLNLPILAPPKWLFAPVWIVMYILLGIYCANLANAQLFKTPLYFLTYTQLILNLLWTIVFFGLLNFMVATIMIVIMDAAVIAILSIDRRKISYLLLPYLIWLLYATYLSVSVYLLN